MTIKVIDTRKRYDIAQELTMHESSTRSFDYYRSDDNRESVLINCVAILQEKHIPIKEKSLESYVLKHINLISDEEISDKEAYIEHLERIVYV